LIHSLVVIVQLLPLLTHRRRRRDATVELSRVSGVYGIRNGDSLDESEQIYKFANSEVELRRVGVGGVYWV